MTTLVPLEPVYAGSFEEVFVEGAALTAFPRGRHAELAARSALASILVLVDGPDPDLETLDLPDAPGVEVLVFDDASPAAAACVRFAGAVSNRVVYRSPAPLGRREASRVLRSLARGADVVEMKSELRSPEARAD